MMNYLHLAELLRHTRRLYRRLRNLDRLEAAQVLAAQAQREARAAWLAASMAQDAQVRAAQAQQASFAQLAANRSLLTTTMRERDRYRGALQRVTGELRQQRAKQRAERDNSRLWITRCTAVNVREN